MKDVLGGVLVEQAAGRNRLARAIRGSVVALRANPNMALGFALIILVTAIAVFAPLLTTYDPLKIVVRDRLQPPSAAHWFGTDDLGRDVYARTIYGARVSLLVGALVATVDLVLGIILGLISGYYRRADAVIMRVMDSLWAIPAILLALALVAVWGASFWSVVIAAGVVFLPTVARLVRGSVLSLRETEFVAAARAVGATPTRIMFVHLLPNAMAPILVQGTYVFAVAILLEAALSFLGTGIPPGTPTWGNVMGDGRRVAQIAIWVLFFPGLFLTIAVLAVNLVGDGLRDALDPKLRGKLRPGA